MSTPVLAYTVTPWPNGLPDVTDPAFRQQALIWVRHLTTEKVAQFNLLTANVNANATVAYQNAQAAAQSAAAAGVAASQAAQSAAAAGAAANARSWVAGASYQVNDVVWGQTSQGVLFRCIQAHTGSSAPPEQDGVRWASIGARVTASPTAGSSSTTLTRDLSGTLTRVDFTLDGKTGSTTLTRDAHGRIATVVTAYDGKTRTETLHRDTAGVLTHITATEE